MQVQVCKAKALNRANCGMGELLLVATMAAQHIAARRQLMGEQK